MFKKIQKIERKKRLIFLVILLPILAYFCLASCYDTISRLPSRDIIHFSLFVLFVYDALDAIDLLLDELKKSNNRISSENSD